jgi:hypothetical protein
MRKLVLILKRFGVVSIGIVILLAPAAIFGQEQKEKWGDGEGEIAKVEIEITKKKEIILPTANRNFEKVPPRAAEPIKPEIVFQFKDVPFNSPNYNPSIKPLRLKDPSIAKIYGNYVSAGFGNYASPYGEAYITSKRDKSKFYGLKFFHRSFINGPVDNGNSGSGNTEIRIFGKGIGSTLTTQGFIQFENQAGHFYGYKPGTDVSSSSIRQDYTAISLGAEVENTKAGNFNFNLKGGFSALSDHYKASEQEISFNFTSDAKINNTGSLILNADYFLINRKDALTNPGVRHIFKVKPAYQYTGIDDLTLTAGANVVYENDTVGGQNGIHVYPNLVGRYKLSLATEVFASLSGDVDKVSLHSLSRENFWINANQSIFNTNRTLEFAGGINSKIAGKVFVGAGVSFASLKNLYYYVSDSLDRSKFNTLYDQGSTQRVNLYTELGYSNEAFKLLVRGDLYSYSSTISSQAAASYSIAASNLSNSALHRPTYKVALNGSYNIFDKILLNTDFYVLGGMKALDVEAKQLVELPAAIDLNFKLNYFVSKQFSAFVQFNNMLSSNYQLYLNYPVRGFQGMVGASWSF